MPTSRVFFAFGVPISAFVAMAACGGAKSTELFSEPPAQTAATTDDTGASDAGGSRADGSTGTKDAGVVVIEENCGKATSCVGPELCCITKSGGGKWNFACSSAAACTGISFPCDSEDDCSSGSQCCGTLSKGALDSVACGTCDKSTAAIYRICDPNAPIDECEAAGMQCQYESSLGFARCKN